MNIPCAVSRDLFAYQGEIDAAEAFEAAIEREIDGFMDLTVREFWARMPDNGRLYGRFEDLLHDMAEHEIEYSQRWMGEPE